MSLIVSTTASNITTGIIVDATSTAQNIVIARNHQIVHIAGSMSTSKLYNENIASKWEIVKDRTEKDIQRLLESNILVVDAEVSVTQIEQNGAFNLRKRSTQTLRIEFIAICALQVSEVFDINKVQLSISDSIATSDPDIYESFDDESFLSFNLSVENPKIIKIQTSSADEIAELIGLIKELEKNLFLTLSDLG